MKKSKTFLKLICFTFFTLFLFSCSKKVEIEKDEKIYKIYYLDTDISSIKAINYVSHSEDVDELIKELMNEITSIPKNENVILPLEERVTFMGYERKENVLYLDFDTNYSLMNQVREILVRAALVKTFTQIKGIEFIGIRSNSKAITDANNNPLPIFYASEFLDTIVDINSFEKRLVTLYFADDKLEALVPEKREIIYNINNKLEKNVIDELIKGPNKDGLRFLLNSELYINNLSIKDNTCYIDFDESVIAFLNKTSAELFIYSIVNTVSEIGIVNKVQFSINGNNEYKFLSGIEISKAFDRNLDYIKEEE